MMDEKWSARALMTTAAIVFAVAMMAQTAPDQWLYDTFVDRNGIMED